MKKLIPLILIALFIVQAWPALAQEDDWQEYISDDGYLTASYPPDWVVGEAPDLLGVRFASNQAALDRADDTESVIPESGDLVASIIVLPVDLLAVLGVEATTDTSQEELTLALADAATGDSDNPDVLQLGDPIEVELEDDETIIIAPITGADLNQAGFIVAWINDGIAVIGIASGFDAEFDDEAQATLLEIILTTEYSGSAEDLMASMGI